MSATAVVPATSAAVTSVVKADAGRTVLEIEAPDAVQVGWRGPVVLRGSSPFEDDVLRVEITGPAGYDEYRVRWKHEGGHDRPYYFPPLSRRGTYRVEASTEYAGVTDSHVIDVDHPAPAIEAAAVSAAVFYPRARDGREDDVTARWRTNRSLYGVVAVVDADDRVVRRWPERLWSREVVQRRHWDGTDDRHRTVPVGPYRILLTARDALGRSVTSTLAVRVGRGSGR